MAASGFTGNQAIAGGGAATLAGFGLEFLGAREREESMRDVLAAEQQRQDVFNALIERESRRLLDAPILGEGGEEQIARAQVRGDEALVRTALGTENFEVFGPRLLNVGRVAARRRAVVQGLATALARRRGDVADFGQRVSSLRAASRRSAEQIFPIEFGAAAQQGQARQALGTRLRRAGVDIIGAGAGLRGAEQRQAAVGEAELEAIREEERREADVLTATQTGQALSLPNLSATTTALDFFSGR